MNITIAIVVITVTLSIGLANFANAEIVSFSPLILEGTGFAVTDNVIKSSEINLAFTTGNIVRGTGPVTIDDGFVGIETDDYVISDLSGSVLREGRFLRIVGTAEGVTDEINLSLFGRLIQESTQGSIYSFTGRIVQNDISHKIVYTSKIIGFGTTPKVSSEVSPTKTENTIRINPGSSQKDFGTTYVEASGTAQYITPTRIITKPGTSFTFVNNDDVAHSIVSGVGLGSNTRITQGTVKICDESQKDNIKFDSGVSFRGDDCTFTMDGRIKTGEILPGESVTVTFEEQGFYRLIDPDYPWMNMIVYSFADADSLIIKQGKNPLGN